ncbi:alpha/beta hydrolase [Frondihabitans australicus]|uniref:S-formylglutathione hydrolase FrmB n=1 Tax=Frondihabitans australicus TaxID=386892 RepID=A0A495IBU2_9MICO|nr:alpha/beta hydrolase-fold protein [Frondihabitans australicus]RKR73392.1 S-formylglutathione hydrolase FrmB [Frondihabitans australicus]
MPGTTALPSWLMSLPITSFRVLAVVDVVAAILAIVLLLPMRRRRWWLWVSVAALVGAVAGGVTIWWVGDVQDVFDVSPTWVDRIWTGVVFAGVLVALVNIALAGWLRKAVAVLAIVAIVLAGGLAINRDVGEFLTPSQLLGTNGYRRILLPKEKRLDPAAEAAADAFDPTLYETWRAPSTMPDKGRVGEVSIPGTVSHFHARDAMVYLPPAALVKHAPSLPVVILMSGQPASPSSVIDAGHIPATLNAFARKNHGLAPIVVVPDQLGASEDNPMCVNGALGNSATYLLDDVPTWIRDHLHVETGRLAWTVGGFSQGATCSIQFATAHPQMFGQFIDISGQQYPTLDNDQQAIVEGFGGSTQAFDDAKPATIMARHGRYQDLDALFGYGQFDEKYGANSKVMSALAEHYGIRVTRYVSLGSAHDWTTATNGFAEGIGLFFPRMGLSATRQSL